jgi:hypothetical protein
MVDTVNDMEMAKAGLEQCFVERGNTKRTIWVKDCTVIMKIFKEKKRLEYEAKRESTTDKK